MNTPLPYRHLSDLSERQLLQVIVDKLCCVAGKYILDVYGGAAAAYSLRSLSKDTTDVVRVRRSSDNAEDDFTADEITDGTLLAWVGNTASDNGFVTTWYDQSGNGNNATQATASQQPQIVSAGSLIFSNGYTVIQYDGTNDNLSTSLTATGTMLMGGSDGTDFYEVAISGSYSLLGNANLTDHPLNESIRVIWGSSLTAAQKTAIESLITYTDWDFSDVTSFLRYWRQRSELTDFPLIDTSNGTNFYQAWYLCSSLSSFPLLNVSNGTVFSYAWQQCSSLTSFPLLDVSGGTDFNSAWRSCSSLTSFPLLDVSNGTNFFRAWRNCSSLTSFPANMFDSVTATDFSNAFGSTNLTSQSIENIVVSIDTAGQTNGTLNITGGGNATTATAQTAIDSLTAKGWTVTVPDGYVSSYLIDVYSGAAAAYSLRQLSYNTTDVVRVRRSSDNAEQDFTAAEITDGTMLNWVNTDVVKYTSDFTSGNEDLNESNGTGSDGETVAGVSDAYKFTLSGGSALHQVLKGGFNSNSLFSVSFDYYIPSTNSKVDGIVFGFIGRTTSSTATLDSWNTISVNSYNSGGGGNLFFRASDGGAVTIDADGDVFYLKNIVVTQTTSDGHVTTWYDQSGNGNNATQSTAANQPKIVDAGVLVEENGKPAVDFLTSSSTYLDTATFSLISQPTTTFAVVRDNSTSAPFRVIHAGTTANKLDLGMNEVDRLYAFSTSLGNSVINIDDQQASVYFLANGASSELGKNDGATQTVNIGSALTQVESLRIGQAEALNADWEGLIQEVILYPTDQSSNKGNIEANINNHYNIYP